MTNETDNDGEDIIRVSVYLPASKWRRLRMLGIEEGASASALTVEAIEFMLDGMSQRERRRRVIAAAERTRGRRGS